MLIGDERKLGIYDLEGVAGDSRPTRRLQLLNRPYEDRSGCERPRLELFELGLGDGTAVQ
jgi:hypothetical protein